MLGPHTAQKSEPAPTITLHMKHLLTVETSLKHQMHCHNLETALGQAGSGVIRWTDARADSSTLYVCMYGVHLLCCVTLSRALPLAVLRLALPPNLQRHILPRRGQKHA
jgi:hypothetical protein